MRSLLLVAVLGCTGPTVDVVANANGETIEHIDRGVLFVNASWSMPSLHARDALETRIANVPIELVLADIDTSPALAEVPALRDRLSGSGESVWVHSGAICFVCTHPDCIDEGLASVTPVDLASYTRRGC